MTNFKPIYFRWLTEHLDHYYFVSDKAKELKQKLLELSAGNTQDTAAMNASFNRFLELFDNDPYFTELGMKHKEKGIITDEYEYYLEENEYGIKLPIQFFKDFGLEAKYSLLEARDAKKAEAGKFLDTLKNDSDQACQSVYTELKKMKFSSSYVKYIILLLCTAYLGYSFWHYREELLHFNINDNINLWMGISFLLSVILVLFGLLDIPKFIRMLRIKRLINDIKISKIKKETVSESIDMTFNNLKKCYPQKAGGTR
jgi:hypothetical protein